MSISPSQTDPSLAPPGRDDRTVVVKYDASTDAWSFTPDSVTMDAPGNIILVRDSSSATWTFVTVAIKFCDDQFAVTVPRTGERCIIRDERRYKGTYKYLVVARDASGRTLISPDPEVVNSGP